MGAKVVSHGRYISLGLPEVAVPQQMGRSILWLIARFKVPSAQSHVRYFTYYRITTSALLNLNFPIEYS